MEDRRTFIQRFDSHREMRELFPSVGERVSLANAAFDAKWEEALVRVTKLDGTQFFID